MYLSFSQKVRLSVAALLILPATFALSLGLKAHAVQAALSGSSCVNNGVRPSPYTGGAGVSRVFYPADGSTVTITTTGAVIKQSPCQTPYREGWVNTADLSCINSESDLSLRLRSGSTNPYHNFATSCPTTPATTSSTSTTTTTSSTSKPVVAAATTTKSTASTTKAATLPNTGPGDVLAIGGISSILGTAGHYIFRVRRFR